MALAPINGIRLGYDDYGTGEPVVMVTGTAAPGRMWRAHQVPALLAAGYRVITIDNRGVAPTEAGPGEFLLADLTGDVAGLIDFLGLGPCRFVGYSLGAVVVQELLLARPDLVREAVLLAACARTDVLGAALTRADIDLCDSGVTLPPRYAAVVAALQNLSPRTLNDESRAGDWLEIFERSLADPASVRRQLALQLIDDRRGAYREIARPCLVVGFADDLIVRPHLCREVAEIIPGATYREISGCGHFGYLERPELVNAAIVEFFGRASVPESTGSWTHCPRVPHV